MEIEDDDIEETDKDFKNFIAGKILSNREISEEFFAGFMPKIWGLVRKVEIERAGRNIFLCKFKNIQDKNRAVKGGPWSFDNAILVFEEPKGNNSVSELDFRYVSF